MGIIIVFLTVTLYSVVKRTVKKKGNIKVEKVKPKEKFLAKFIFNFDEENVVQNSLMML